MSSAHDMRPIIVRRAKSHARPHGNHSWKIAYADFMTAMMALFLVLWLLSSANKKTLEGIAEYFRMPLKVAIVGGEKSSQSPSVIPGGGMDVMRKDGEIMRARDNDPSEEQRRNELQEGQRLRALKQRLEQLIESNPMLRQFRPQLLLDITSEGLRIQILDTQNRPMFRTGSAFPGRMSDCGPDITVSPTRMPSGAMM